MLSFKALSEKKTKIKINPKQSEITEKKGCNHTKKGMECPMHGMDKCPDTEVEEGYKGYSKGGEVEPPKERLKTDRNMFNIPKDEQDAARERLKAKAAAKRKQLKKEEAYVSQEEVSEESTKEVAETETSLLTFGQFAEGLSIDDQMRISREHNRKSPEEKKAANKKAMGNVKKVAPKKDTRTDAQKMTDATGPRPGSRYRGD
mgnify:CR=1 FL=1|jgi:hypothetical protein|tara:strand:- start:64 stop:672 length:609 start_codon:yes stop_codon:yes gene_type:complete